MPTFCQHHGQITKALPSFTEIIFKLLPSFKHAPLIPTVFRDRIKWFELQKYTILQPLHALLSAQIFLLFSFFIPPRSCSLLAVLHLSNTQECKTMLTHHSVSLPPISSVCLTISIPGAASQPCKAVLIFHIHLEILVTYIQHQFSFSWLQGIFFLKINLKLTV